MPRAVQAVGQLRQRRQWRAFSGQSHQGEAGCEVIAAMHHHRAENWVLVSGMALVRLGEDDIVRFKDLYEGV